MPNLELYVAEIMKLHQDCKTYRSLPCSGALLDQPAGLMDLFRVIDATTARVRAELTPQVPNA